MYLSDCRSTKGYVAQLMRLYVCTPEGPVRVTVGPHIQPSSPPSPIFSLGTENPVELPAGSVWVVRLPYPSKCSVHVQKYLHFVKFVQFLALNRRIFAFV